jgi:hypothetical protein
MNRNEWKADTNYAWIHMCMRDRHNVKRWIDGCHINSCSSSTVLGNSKNKERRHTHTSVLLQYNNCDRLIRENYRLCN